MKRTLSTDQLLTLGMALYSDQRTMEQRVRGVFARRRSAAFVCALAALVCLGACVGCFTTACVPAHETAASAVVETPMPDKPAATPIVSDEGALPAAERQIVFQNVADWIARVFEESVRPADMRPENGPAGYTVYAPRPGETEPAYYAVVNPETGAVERVGLLGYDRLPLSAEQRAEAEGYDMRAPRTIVDEVALEWACTPVARALVERCFADGRAIADTDVSFTMSDSVMYPRVQVGVYVQMDAGDSYVVTLIWPQILVSECSVADADNPPVLRASPTPSEPTVFDGVSYFHLPIDERFYNVEPAYRYENDEAARARLPDVSFSEAEARSRAMAALAALVPEYAAAPERYTLDAVVRNDGLSGDYPAWRFELSDRSAGGVQRGQITLWLDRSGNAGRVYVQARSAFDDRDVDVELKFSEQELIELALACLEKNGHDSDAAHYAISVEARETETLTGDPAVQWKVVLVSKTASGQGVSSVFEVSGNGRTGNINAFWDAAGGNLQDA